MTGWPSPGPLSQLPPRPRPYPFWGYHDVILFIGLSLPSLLAGVAVTLLAGRFLNMPGKAMPLLLAQFTGYGIWFLSLYLLFRVRYHRPFWDSLAWTGTKSQLAAGLVIGPLIAINIAIAGALLQAPEVEMPIRELLSDRVSVALVGVFATTLGPLCEELAFRGFLMPLLVRSAGPAAGIVLAALPFALLHGPQYGWSWSHVTLVGVAGVCFGVARHVTGSTAVATAMHATYNLTFFAGFLMQGRSGTSPW
jgi:uncharacterized protein